MPLRRTQQRDSAVTQRCEGIRDFRLRRLVPAILVALGLPSAYANGTCPGYTFIKIADTSTPVPGGDGGAFAGPSFSEPAVTLDEVAFRGEGGGTEGVFAGDGTSLRNLVSLGDSVAGGGVVDDLFADFTFGAENVDAILTPSGGARGIYGNDGAGPMAKIVGFGDAAPTGGDFSTLFFVSRDLGALAFQASVSFTQATSGVFTRIDGTNAVVADTTDSIPGAPGLKFGGGSFSDPDISGEDVVFRAGFGGHTGVYAQIDGTLIKVVDVTDTQPGSANPFTTFTIPVIDDQRVAFRATGAFTAVYVWSNGSLASIAKAGDPAPGGSTFAGFGPNVASADGEVAFGGAGSGFIGLFVSGKSGLCRVIDTNDTLDGKDVVQLFMGRDSYAYGRLGFRAVFSDGSRAIYLARAVREVPPLPSRPAAPGSTLQGVLLLLFGSPD